MKKIILSMASVLLAISIITISVIGASAAVYIQDGKFTYRFNDDGTVSWAGYTGDTVDDVVVPNAYDTSAVVSVASFGLENNANIKSIDFMSAPDLTSIEKYAFSGCTSLESVIVPDRISSVDVSAFRGCTALKKAEFYGNNNIVPVEAFYNCTALENVRLSAYTRAIQSRAFAGCTSLQYLELLDTVQYIAPNAFDGSENLTLGVFYNTYAYTYAKKNNVPYVLLDRYLKGDVNFDDKVDIRDVTKIQRYKAEMEDFDDLQFLSADVTGDDNVTVADVTKIQRYIAEFADAKTL